MRRNTNAITYRSYRTASFARRARHIFLRKNLVYEYLESVMEPCVWGFDYKYDQVRRYPNVVEWCREHDVKVIHLIRDNVLKVLVSREIARKRGVYLSSRPLKQLTVRIHTSNLVDRMDDMVALVTFHRNMFKNFDILELKYEALVADTAGQSRRMLEFLGVSDQTLTSHFVKHGSDSPQNTIENLDDVYLALQGTSYEHLIA